MSDFSPADLAPNVPNSLTLDTVGKSSKIVAITHRFIPVPLSDH